MCCFSILKVAFSLTDAVISGLGDIDGAYIADLYAGGGTFSVPLALAGADVVAVEAAGSSVRDLRANAEANGVDIEVVGGDAARELAELGELDALVVDPPRAGLGVEGARAFAQLPARSLVLISCDPAAMARDVATMVASGRRVVAIESLDMFPNTHHVETVVLMSKAN